MSAGSMPLAAANASPFSKMPFSAFNVLIIVGTAIRSTVRLISVSLIVYCSQEVGVADEISMVKVGYKFNSMRAPECP